MLNYLLQKDKDKLDRYLIIKVKFVLFELKHGPEEAFFSDEVSV